MNGSACVLMLTSDGELVVHVQQQASDELVAVVVLQVVHKLGPLEWILNTPSHHRVHHGRNRYCIDKNYAGVFIIWDRLFGVWSDSAVSP